MMSERYAEALHDRLHCEARLEFVVSLVGAGRTQALVTDDFDVARREAEAHAKGLVRIGLHPQVPADVHELHQGRRMTWTHPDRTRGVLTLGRLVHHQALCPEAEPQALLAVIGHQTGTPVLFVATGRDARAEHHLRLLRKLGPGLRFKAFPAVDLRGAGDLRRGTMTPFAAVASPTILSPLPEIGVEEPGCRPAPVAVGVS